jgi:hypothetical protein
MSSQERRGCIAQGESVRPNGVRERFCVPQRRSRGSAALNIHGAGSSRASSGRPGSPIRGCTGSCAGDSTPDRPLVGSPSATSSLLGKRVTAIRALTSHSALTSRPTTPRSTRSASAPSPALRSPRPRRPRRGAAVQSGQCFRPPTGVLTPPSTTSATSAWEPRWRDRRVVARRHDLPPQGGRGGRHDGRPRLCRVTGIDDRRETPPVWVLVHRSPELGG